MAAATEECERRNQEGVTEPQPTRMPPASMLRGVAVMLGPSVVLDGFVAGGTAMLLKRRLHPIVLWGAAMPWLYVLLIRPPHAALGRDT